MKKLLLIFIVSIFFISCYITDNNSGTGSITFDLPETMKASANVETILKLRFFNEGEMQVLPNFLSATISYATDYPTPVSVTGQSEFSYTSSDTSGSVTVTGVPSDKPLQILAECLIESYEEGSGLWYIERAGLSNSFTLGEGENANVSIALLGAVYGSVTVNNDKGWSTCYFRAYEPDDLDSFIYTEEGTAYRNPTEPVTLCEAEGSVSGNLIFQDAILPGRKMKMLITNQSSSDSDPVGLSEEFELRPGETKTISASYYSSCIQIS